MNGNFLFKNGKTVKINYSDRIISINNVPKYAFKGSFVINKFENKRNELDGIVVKINDSFNNNYFICMSEENDCIRKSSLKCFEIIPTLEKDKKDRIKQLEK